jgi:hypothetical protein
MRIPVKTLAVLAFVVASLAQAATASPAAANHGGAHWLRLSGNLDIFDDEPWPKDGVWCEHTLGGADPGVGAGSYAIHRWDNRCDGEIRVEMSVYGRREADGRICDVRYEWLLYEGKNTDTADLDGIKHRTLSCIAPGHSVTVTGSIKNTAEGGDYANYTFTLHHDV